MAAGVSALSADFSRTDALPSMMISPRATAVPLAMAAGAAATSQDSTIGGIFKDAGTLTYFAGLKSRGEPTQMIAKYGGVQMKVNLITFEEWGQLKSDKIPFMPFITQPDGKIVLETEYICKHLAIMGGKFVVDSKQEELCKIANSAPMQLADPLYNLPDGGASLGVPPFEKWLEAVIPVLKDLVSKLGDGPFFAGEAPGYGEAFIFHDLDNQFALAKPELTAGIGLEAMAKLEAFYARFAALDGIKEYLAERPKVWGVPGSKANPP
jgi:glutathione S-transferase